MLISATIELLPRVPSAIEQPNIDAAPSSDTPRPRLSIAILAFNEERLIGQCIDSAAFADEVVVVDAGSADRTVEIARTKGACVHIYPDWRGFAVQRNHLLSHVSGDFVFFLDADEVITPAFREELLRIVSDNDQHSIWRIRWQLVAFGRVLPKSMSRTRVARLFPRRLIERFDGVVHEEAILREAEVGRQDIQSLLIHYTNPDVSTSMAKMVQYAMLGATKRKEQGKRGGVLRGLAAGAMAFIRYYVIRMGFLGGGAGFLYCLFKALESFFRYAALRYDYEQLSDDVQRRIG
ncbi:glycosyltransferase family 2 protein [Lampropedia puyangensis]|uniref:Glycosyltransferase family 2 protein n=1 Tax=Lampropedia puyangensis TaxID=1330072 RepID=A0A4V4GRF5_9BURK|nr:glycosyltransferase family 2 protein [Lampropedia puyangensis]THU01466.1 glycosyltransferase family 2 protein [Lampropedia puyangensis]